MLRWCPYVLAFSPLVSFQSQTISQSQPTSQPSAATSSDTKPKQGKPNCTNNGTYVNSRGQTVPRPENCSAGPKGATAQCRDGSCTFSQSRCGTYSHHGGVQVVLKAVQALSWIQLWASFFGSNSSNFDNFTTFGIGGKTFFDGRIHEERCLCRHDYGVFTRCIR